MFQLFNFIQIMIWIEISTLLGNLDFFCKFHANIKARDAPLNIVRFHSNFFWIFFIMFGTKLEGERMTFLTFCVKDQPNVYNRASQGGVFVEFI